MKTNQHKWFWSIAVVTLVLSSLTYGHKGQNITKVEPTNLAQTIPSPAYQLFQWPAPFVQNGPNRLDDSAPEGTWPKRQSIEWIQKVLAPSWLPTWLPKNAEFPKDAKILEDGNLILIRDEFDERDVVRMEWEQHGYNIQVSQTASIITIKLSPVGNKNTGTNSTAKLERAKQLCLQLFATSGYRWSANGHKVPIEDLSQKIVSYSFRPEMLRHLKDDDTVCGRPQTLIEAGVQLPQNDIERLQEKNPNNPDWDKTADAWQYWFRMVNWWNDGKSIGFYFLKVESGSWIPNYAAPFDKSFF